MAQLTVDDALHALHDGDLERAGDSARAIIAQYGYWVPEAVHILASIAVLQGRSATAIALIGRVLQQGKGKRSAALEGRLHQTLGRALLAEKRYDAARAAFSVAVMALPEEAASQAGLGEAYLMLQRPEKALQPFRNAVVLAPQQAALWSLLAQAYHQHGAFQYAVQSWEKVVEIAPHDRAAWANYGADLFAAGRWDKAAWALDKALEQGCYTPHTLNNMGLVKSAQGHMEDACRYFERAHRQSPDDVDILINWNAALYDMGRGDEAEALLERLAEKQGNCPPKARFNKAALLLERGEWAEGWRAFEARRDILPQRVTHPLPDLPLWQGDAGAEPIALYAEQGMGDTVQFLRFLPDALKRRPVRLHLPQDMMKLVAQHYSMLPAERLLASEGPVVAQQSLLSLPYILGIDGNPETTPYLHASSAEEEGLIGLCWAGNGSYAFNRRRSLPVTLLEPLRYVQGARFLSLQQDSEAPEWMDQVPLTSLLDLSEAVGRCSLVISVDTLVAHIAGAQGRPLWLLNRKGGDWRWKRPFWYPEARVFQAKEATPPHDSWPPVIEQVRDSLKEWLLCPFHAENRDENADGRT